MLRYLGAPPCATATVRPPLPPLPPPPPQRQARAPTFGIWGTAGTAGIGTWVCCRSDHRRRSSRSSRSLQ